MKTTFFTAAAVLYACSSLLAQKQIEKKWGAHQFDGAFSAAATSDGGYIVSGLTKSQGDQDGDIIIVKTTAQGDILWTLKHGGEDLEGGNGIMETGDGEYLVIGHSESFGHGVECDAFLMKVDKAGNKKWLKTYGDMADDIGESAVELPGGGFVMIGNTANFGARDRDFYIVKTDAEGNEIWARHYDRLGTDYGYSIVRTADGGFLAAGSTKISGTALNDGWLLRLDAGGDTLWTKTFGGAGDDRFYQILPAQDGGFILAGYNSSIGNGESDGWLVKLNADEKVSWQKTFGGSAHDVFSGVAVLPDGNFMASGFTKSSDTLGMGYVVKVDQDGDLLSSSEYGKTAELQTIAVQGKTSFMVAGYTAGWNLPESDLYMMEIDYSSGISEVEMHKNLLVYPNPVSRFLHFNLDEPAGNARISDVTGKIVLEGNLNAATRLWDVSMLPSGTYILRYEKDQKILTTKFVKQ